MTSPSVRQRSQHRESIDTTPIATCAKVSGYNPGAYVVMSPVLVPYVQAPVQYVKCKPKKVTERTSASPAKVRYVPAYTYTTVQPQYVYYNRKNATSLPMANVGAPFAMRVNHNAMSINQGYVSALAPSPVFVKVSEKSAPHSGLNPLSRPYTPPSRLMNQCRCSQEANEAKDNSCPKHPNSGRSSPELFHSDFINEVASRGGTPVTKETFPCHSEKKESHLSDTDSGVEGETDDEAWSTCSKDSFSPTDTKSTQSMRESEEYPNLLPDLCKEDQAELSRVSSCLIDFLCSHLALHEWRAVARELGVSDVIIQSVEYDVYDNFREEMRFVFSFWVRSHQSQSYEEMCLQLEKALAEIGRNDLTRELKSTDCVTEGTRATSSP